MVVATDVRQFQSKFYQNRTKLRVVNTCFLGHWYLQKSDFQRFQVSKILRNVMVCPGKLKSMQLHVPAKFKPNASTTSQYLGPKTAKKGHFQPKWALFLGSVFFEQKNFKFFFLKSLKWTIWEVLGPFSENVYLCHLNKLFFGVMHMTVVRQRKIIPISDNAVRKGIYD